MKYTEKLHARRLYNMLRKKGNLSVMCPASKNYAQWNTMLTGDYQSIEACKICMSFVGIKYENLVQCPCYYFGEDKAIARSLAALRERGFKC